MDEALGADSLFLVGAERADRIDPGGATGREVPGEKRDRHEAERHRDEGEGIMRGHAKEDGAEKAGHEKSSEQTDDDPGGGEPEGLPEDELENAGARRPEGKADADFLVPLRHEVGDDAVNSETGEAERENRKEADQPGAETRRGGGIVDERLHRAHFHDHGGIEHAERAAHAGRGHHRAGGSAERSSGRARRRRSDPPGPAGKARRSWRLMTRRARRF